MSWSPTPNLPRFLKPLLDDGSHTGLPATMNRFLDFCLLKGYSEQTLYGYERYLRDFICWCDANQVRSTAEFNIEVFRSYQRWLLGYRKRNGQALAVYSQISKLVPVRSLIRWLARNESPHLLGMTEFELPKSPKTIPKQIFSVPEAEWLLTRTIDDSLVGLRDRAILEVFYGTGIRRMELIQLELDDIDTARGTLLVRHGKGQKDRLVPIGDRAIHHMDVYVNRARPAFLGQGNSLRLFLNRQGGPLSPSWLSGVVGNYVRKTKPGRRGACHLLRHSMATSMLENGADIRYIQAILGHAQLSSTQIYTQVAMHQLRKVHAATHPTGMKLAKLTDSKPKAVKRPAHPLRRELDLLLANLPSNASLQDLASLVTRQAIGASVAS